MAGLVGVRISCETVRKGLRKIVGGIFRQNAGRAIRRPAWCVLRVGRRRTARTFG